MQYARSSLQSNCCFYKICVYEVYQITRNYFFILIGDLNVFEYTRRPQTSKSSAQRVTGGVLGVNYQ
jgi:hypothetical protein